MRIQPGTNYRCATGLLLAAMTVTLLGGCAEQTVTPPHRLSVMPLAVQIHQINQIAARIHAIRLTGSITIHYYNRHNQAQSLSLHAVLLINRLASSATSVESSSRQAEVLLLTTYLGQNAMELGVNRRGYWLINHQKNVAYIGHLDSSGQTPPGVLPLNPAELLGLLGFASLPTDGRTLRTVVPGAADVRLLVLGTEHGRPAVRRQIDISRYTGRIVKVTLFNDDARASAICSLAHYPTLAPEALDSTHTPIAKLICRRFSITVPARRISIAFHVHHVYAKLPGKARFIFRRPSLQGDKIREIVPADAMHQR